MFQVQNSYTRTITENKEEKQSLEKSRDEETNCTSGVKLRTGKLFPRGYTSSLFVCSWRVF